MRINADEIYIAKACEGEYEDMWFVRRGCPSIPMDRFSPEGPFETFAGAASHASATMGGASFVDETGTPYEEVYRKDHHVSFALGVAVGILVACVLFALFGYAMTG